MGLSYLAFIKIILGEDIGTRPLLLVSILFIVMAVQFLTTGVMSEVQVRTYHESRGRPAYLVRIVSEQETGNDDTVWKYPEIMRS